MTDDAPKKTNEEGRVLQFRPRPPSRVEAFSNLKGDKSPVDDLGKYTQANRDQDDYAHRMKVNAIAVIFLAALVGGGIWVVDMMAQQRKIQDCVLTGRRNCATDTFPLNAR